MKKVILLSMFMLMSILPGECQPTKRIQFTRLVDVLTQNLDVEQVRSLVLVPTKNMENFEQIRTDCQNLAEKLRKIELSSTEKDRLDEMFSQYGGSELMELFSFQADDMVINMDIMVGVFGGKCITEEGQYFLDEEQVDE